jgi:hypothetical protein
MIVEDAHWADPTTVELFSLVVGVIRTLRALLIVTFRPESRAEFCYVAHRRLYSDMLRLPSCAKVGKRERPPTKAAY